MMHRVIAKSKHLLDLTLIKLGSSPIIVPKRLITGKVTTDSGFGYSFKPHVKPDSKPKNKRACVEHLAKTLIAACNKKLDINGRDQNCILINFGRHCNVDGIQTVRNFGIIPSKYLYIIAREDLNKLLLDCKENLKTEMKKKNCGPNGRTKGIAECLHVVGCVYRKMGEHQEAEKYLKAALDTYFYVFPEEYHNPASANTLHELGLNYIDQGEYKKAKHFLRNSHLMLLYCEDYSSDFEGSKWEIDLKKKLDFAYKLLDDDIMMEPKLKSATIQWRPTFDEFISMTDVNFDRP